MAIYIDTSECSEIKLSKAEGTVKEIINKELCGAESGVVSIRKIPKNGRYTFERMNLSKQLVYLMDGEAIIHLEGKECEVKKGSGLYLENGETAEIKQQGSSSLELLHVVVQSSLANKQL